MSDIKSSKSELEKKFQDLITFAFDRLLEQSMTLKVFRQIIGVKITVDPSFMITQAGPFFFKYREHIQGDNLKFFLNHDFAEQLKDLNDITAGYGSNIAVGFIDNIKTTLEKVDPKLVKSLVSNMLQTYSMYVIECRKEKK